MKTLDSYVIEPEAKRGPGRPKMYPVPPELREFAKMSSCTRFTRSGRSMHGHLEVTWWESPECGTIALRGMWPGGREEWQLRGESVCDGPWRGTGLTPQAAHDAWKPLDAELPTDEQLDDPAQHLARFQESCRNFRLNFPQYQMEAERALPGCRLCAVADHFVRWEHAGMGVELYAFPCWVWAATRYTGESRDHDSAADAIAEAIDLHAQSLMQRSA